MTGVRVVTDIAAPVGRVWRALVSPAEVRAWDGAEPIDVPDDYPRRGHHARWRVTLAARPVVLHDRVRLVDAERTLQSDITYAFLRLDETYALWPTEAGTRLLTSVSVAATTPGLGRLAWAITGRTVRSAMTRLRTHCEAPESAG